MLKADYKVVQVTRDTVFLVDLDLGQKTVTNDAEAVVEEVTAAHPGLGIVYRDTMGRWDELRYDGSRFTGFGPWSGPTP